MDFLERQELSLEEWSALLRSQGKPPAYVQVALDRARERGDASERKRRRASRREVELDESLEDPTSWFYQLESRDELTFYLKQLPVLWRCILLARLQGYRHHEIDHLLDLTPGTAKTSVREAFAYLRSST